MSWRKILTIASKKFNRNQCDISGKRTWCAWTTFERLGEDAGYWTAPLPLESELLLEGTSDGGTWGQPFRYEQIAHLIVPRRFSWENLSEEGFDCGIHEQDIAGLAEQLRAEGICHRVTDLVLEVKLY